MKNAVKKLFGGCNLTWPKVIIAAVTAGIFTAAMAMIPALEYTSFHAITVTLEIWILFGILIIMNSRSSLDAGLKCFVFFLISQPLVYLLQVPFSVQGWGLFKYYRYWLLWTVLCFPMGCIGYYMKKNRWWGYLILLPMIALTASSYLTYFSDFLFSRPRYVLIALFCAAVIILYPVLIFDNRKIRIAGAAIGGVLVVVLTVLCLCNPPVYSTEIMGNGEEYQFDDTYKVFLADDRYGDVEIRYLESVEDYMVHADFRRSGSTVLTMVSPTGETTGYDLRIEPDSYKVTKRAPVEQP